MEFDYIPKYFKNYELELDRMMNMYGSSETRMLHGVKVNKYNSRCVCHNEIWHSCPDSGHAKMTDRQNLKAELDKLKKDLATVSKNNLDLREKLAKKSEPQVITKTETVVKYKDYVDDVENDPNYNIQRLAFEQQMMLRDNKQAGILLIPAIGLLLGIGFSYLLLPFIFTWIIGILTFIVGFNVACKYTGRNGIEFNYQERLKWSHALELQQRKETEAWMKSEPTQIQ